MNSSNAESSQCSPELNTGVEGLAQIVANRDCQFSQKAYSETTNTAASFSVFFLHGRIAGLKKMADSWTAGKSAVEILSGEPI